MAQASVNLAKSQGLASSVEGSSISGEESIDFKSLEDELYDDEVTHILSKENGTNENSINSNDSLNTPEIDYMGPCGDPVIESYSDDKEKDERSKDENSSDAHSAVDGCREENGSNASGNGNGLKSVSESEENSQEGNVSQNSDGYEDISDTESERDGNDDVDKKQTLLSGKSPSKLYDPISDDSNLSDDLSRKSLSRPSTMYEPVSDDEDDGVDDVKGNASQDDVDDTNISKTCNVSSIGEKSKDSDTKSGIEQVENGILDGDDSMESAEMVESAEMAERKSEEGESNLIVSEVYSLKDTDQIMDENEGESAADDDCNRLSTHNSSLNSESKLEDGKKSNLKHKNEKGSRRKAKHSVRKSLDEEMIPELEAYPGIQIKEEPLDYDEYGQYNSTEYPQIEFNISGGQTAGEFEYLDGTSVNVAPKTSKSSSENNLPYEVLREGDDVVYRCKLCSCRFHFFFKYEAHRLKVHSKKYSCKYCGEQFDRSQILAIHVRVKHVLDSFVKKKTSEGESSHGKIRKFSIAEKKKKHESGLYGSQIVNTGTVATEEMETNVDEIDVPRKKKKVLKYVDLQGNLVSKAQTRKKLSSTVFVDGTLMYKCSYCHMLFEKQQKMACHVRNQHILEKSSSNRLIYQRRIRVKNGKANKFPKHKELETPITTVAEEDLDYMLNEEGDIIARKKDTEERTEAEMPAMYIDTEKAQKLSDELAKEGIRNEPKIRGKKRRARSSVGLDQTDEEISQLQEVQIDSKVFKCQHCTKWFFRKNDLDFHMQRHVLRNDFKNVGENNESQNDPCNDEMNAMTEEFRPVSFCKYCPSKFESFNKLKIHVMRHVGEVELSDDISRKKFTCRLCGEGTNDSKSIKKHLKSHFQTEIENLDPHNLCDCKYCGLPFLSTERLQGHEKAHSDFLVEKINQKRLKERRKSESMLIPGLVSQICVENNGTNSEKKSSNDVTIQGSSKKVSNAHSSKPTDSENTIPLTQILGEQVERAFESNTDNVSNVKILDSLSKPPNGQEKMKSILPPDLKTKLSKMKEKMKSEEKEEKTKNEGKEGKKDDNIKDEKDSEKDKEDDKGKPDLRESLIQILFEKVPFECGMCNSRFPNSQFLLHHMTLHMKGKYVFRVDQDSESEMQIQSTNVEQHLKYSVSASKHDKSPQQNARPVNSVSFTKKPQNLKSVSKSPSKPAILKHSQPKPAAPSPGTSLIPQMNPVYAYPPSVIPTPNDTPAALNSTLLVRKVAPPPPTSKNIILPRVISHSVASFGHSYAKPYPQFSSPPQAPLPQAPMHLPYNPSGPLILAPSGGQPIYLVPSSVEQATKGVSLLSSSKLGNPTSSAPIFYSPANNPGVQVYNQGTGPTSVQNQTTIPTPVQNQGTVPTMGGKPLISIINPNLQSGSSLLKHPAKPKASLQKVTMTKVDPALKTGSTVQSLTKKLQREDVEKNADDLPNIDSDEDLMNCSSPDSVMDMNSDSDVEDSLNSTKLPPFDSPLIDDKDSQLVKNEDEAVSKSQDVEKGSDSKLEARKLIDKVKKKYMGKVLSRKDRIIPIKGSEIENTSRKVGYSSAKLNSSKFRMRKKIDFAKGIWYECPLCMFQYGNLNDYQKHLKTHKGLKKNKLHTCITCGRQFLTKFHLEKHKTVHRKNAYQCSHCDMSFDSANEVVDHMATVHPA